MEKSKEKEIIYESLMELTKESEPNRYFSRKRIMENIKQDIEEETGSHIHYRKGNVLTYLGGTNWDSTTIDLNDILPKQKTLLSNIEELVKEGKVQEIITIWQGGIDNGIKFYRANLNEIKK